MSRRTRRIPLQIPRVALLVLLVVGLVAQSLVAIMGDLHESVLHADAGAAYMHQHAGHAHHDLGHDAAHEQTDPASDTAATEAMHMLQHQSCGGHCMWIADSRGADHQILWQAVILPVDPSRHIAASDYSAPFRPPISV